MPVYLHIYNLIVKKSSVIEKYEGGIEQFRHDFSIDASEINQEDDELFSFGEMNADSFPIERLIEKGFGFDKIRQYSDDFSIL
jgi:hypothetical protein